MTSVVGGTAELGAADRGTAEFGKRVAAATRWSLLNTVVIRLGTFATGVLLARYLLGPREWGLYGIGTLVLAVLLSANEMGVSLALVRWDRDVRSFAPTVMTLSTAASLLLYALLYLAAPGVARMLGSPEATTLLRVLCFAVVIDGVACVPAGVLTRQFAQGTRMLVDLANFVVSTALTVWLAVAGLGAMSFAWGAVAGNAVSLVGSALAAPGMLRFGWHAPDARALLRFGLPLAGASLLVLGVLNVDSAVVGATLGPTALGLYQVAFNMSSWPVRTVSEAARRVSFAGFSRLAHSSSALADGFGRALRLLMVAAVPACVLLATLAEPVIRVVYGPRWVGAAVALQFLAVLGLIRVAFELAYDCLGAAGRRTGLLAVQAWWLATLAPALIVLARWYGIEGVGAGQAVVAGLLVAPAFLVALARAGVPPRTVVRACAVPLAGGAASGGTALVVHRLAGDTLSGLVIAGMAALVVYAVTILPTLRRLANRGGARPTDDDAVPVPVAAVDSAVGFGAEGG